MKVLFKVLGVLVLLAVLAAAGGVAYLKLAFPKVGPAPDLEVVATPEAVARGEYLANHVSVCMDCHSERDWTKFSGPLVSGTLGKGGQVFNQAMGLPGELYARNITPASLGSWTDGEILRAFTAGVTKDGRAMFPLMPYPAYGRMARQDAEAVVAYLRQIAPIEHTVPDSKLDFPVSLIVGTMPREADPMPLPDRQDTLAYGRYLTTIAGCGDCHTPAEKGQRLPGMDFAGGFEFGFPDGSVVRSLNITPDPETGTGGWDRAFFIQRFKFYGSPEAASQAVAQGAFNTVMPWTVYAGMTEEDLGAIFEYLKTVKPVKHTVERFTARQRASS